MTRVLGLLLLFVASGCHTRLTRLYDGPERPRSQIATILRGSKAEILSVDSHEGDAFEFHVPPGCHYVWVDFHREFVGGQATWYNTMSGKREKTGGAAKYTSSALFAVEMRAAHYYEITSTFTGDVFVPRLVEYDPAGERLFAYSPAPPDARDCAPSRSERLAAPP